MIDGFLQSERLPESYRDTIGRWYLPLADRLEGLQRGRPSPLVVGINGAQGSGKSTLAKFLALVLSTRKHRTAELSLDDFYLDRRRRLELADSVHPLLATRGVPGTHDIALAECVLADLQAAESRRVSLPRFDKARDEPRPVPEWPRVETPLQFVLLEGWFLGVEPEAAQSLEMPLNDLERLEDPDGRWRRYVNQRLRDYQPVFAQVNFLIMLRAPSFDCVYRWRALQEQKLRQATGSGPRHGIMDPPALRRFIQHFERLTRHGLESLPGKADLVFNLDAQQGITTVAER